MKPDALTVKVNIEALFEGKPIELEFVREAIKEKFERESELTRFADADAISSCPKPTAEIIKG